MISFRVGISRVAVTVFTFKRKRRHIKSLEPSATLSHLGRCVSGDKRKKVVSFFLMPRRKRVSSSSS